MCRPRPHPGVALITEDGHEEGVVLAFVREGAVLVEHRPTDDAGTGTGTETFLPSGSVEPRDEATDHADRRRAALHREVHEETAGAVTPERVHHVGTTEVAATDPPLRLHTYAVTAWTGPLPEHTVEDGERYATLEWLAPPAARTAVDYGSAVRMLDQLCAHAATPLSGTGTEPAG